MSIEANKAFDEQGQASPRALEFLHDYRAAEPAHINKETIVTLRRTTRAACESTCQDVLRRLQSRITETRVAGVKVQQVTPASSVKPFARCAILYFYGGAYIQGSPFEDLPICAPLATKTGCKVIAPQYRLAPEHPYPAALDDAWTVYTEIVKEYGTHNIALVGESAGGNLALALALRAHAEGTGVPAVMGLMSPWSCLENLPAGDHPETDPDPTLKAAYINQAARLFAAGLALSDPRISPLNADYGNRFPPTIITSGTRDLLVGQCTALASRLIDSGNEVEFNLWKDMWHVFEYYPQIPEAEMSLNDVARFLLRHLI